MLRPLSSSFRPSASILSTSKLLSTQCRLSHAKPDQEVLIVRDHADNFFHGDVIRVRPGYMRNFLYPRKIAIYNTAENRKQFEEQVRIPAVLEKLEQRKKGFRIKKKFRNVKPFEFIRGIISSQSRITMGVTQYKLAQPITKQELVQRLHDEYDTKFATDDITFLDSGVAVNAIEYIGTFQVSIAVAQYDTLEVTIVAKQPEQESSLGGAIEEHERQVREAKEARANREAEKKKRIEEYEARFSKMLQESKESVGIEKLDSDKKKKAAPPAKTEKKADKPEKKEEKKAEKQDEKADKKAKKAQEPAEKQ